jgi:hypothetical protein
MRDKARLPKGAFDPRDLWRGIVLGVEKDLGGDRQVGANAEFRRCGDGFGGERVFCVDP